MASQNERLDELGLEQLISLLNTELSKYAKKGESGGTSGGTSISKIEQTTTSSEDGGINVITVTLTNGTTATFRIQNGSKGSTGPQGPQGNKGDTGAQGPKGDKGDKGDTGGTGPQGPQGNKGDTGDTGPTGPQGPTGPKGSDGHSPYVGDNGNWFVWSDDREQYEDSYLQANGYPPFISGGTWWVWLNTMVGYYDTEIPVTGANGDAGYTPQREIDYWTEEDKEEIRNYVNSAILGGEW